METLIKSYFHVNSQADTLNRIFTDIFDRLDALENPPKPEPKKTHKDYKMHKYAVCGKTGRIAKDTTCDCVD